MTSTLSPVDVGRPWIATSWMVVTGLLFVCVTGIVRYIGSDVPAAQAAFIRYIIGLFIMLPFMGEILKGRFVAVTSYFIRFVACATRWV